MNFYAEINLDKTSDVTAITVEKMNDGGSTLFITSRSHVVCFTGSSYEAYLRFQKIAGLLKDIVEREREHKAKHPLPPQPEISIRGIAATIMSLADLKEFDT